MVVPPIAREAAHGGSVLALRFQHEKGNIITAALVSALREELRQADAPDRRLILIEGAGANFSFGASVPEHAPRVIDRVLPEFHALLVALLDAPAATAAVVRGRCLGGGFELALACDFIFASDDAQFGLPEIGLGVFPPVGSILLPLRAGLARATSTVLCGDARPAAYWRDAGVIELMAPAADLPGEIDAWYARHLAPRSPTAIRYACRAVRHAARERMSRVLPEIERLYLTDLMRTRDAVEGIAAFIEKRAPTWTGE
jgi:cyclohexa-1,5-dienecarbonyl-CoA hydratase